MTVLIVKGKGVKWGDDLTAGQMYQVQAPKVNDGHVTDVVITELTMYVRSDGTVIPFVTFRIIGDDGDRSHVCIEAPYFVAHVIARLI